MGNQDRSFSSSITLSMKGIFFLRSLGVGEVGGGDMHPSSIFFVAVKKRGIGLSDLFFEEMEEEKERGMRELGLMLFSLTISQISTQLSLGTIVK